eukprot:4812393-Alexandrium_andersonii.AAC.1
MAAMNASTSSMVVGGCLSCSSTESASRRPPSLQAARQPLLARAHACCMFGSSSLKSESSV